MTQTHSQDVLPRPDQSPDEVMGYISYLADNDQLQHFGSFSHAIYDTAWASMVYKQQDGEDAWLLPQCFAYILNTQQADGLWPAYTSEIDGILNSLAGLLSLLVHQSRGQNEPDHAYSIERRIHQAKTGLVTLLSKWDVDRTDHVAFEILVPCLLAEIKQFDVQFDFEGKEKLMRLYTAKMAKFQPAMVYSKHRTTILHSVEALGGLIEYDKLRHHCTADTGMMGSPAATAAYLMKSSVWDDRAEAYLRMVVGPSGGVPNAFPTYVFELSWTLSTMTSNTMKCNVLNQDRIAKFFQDLLQQQNGTVGFARGLVVDADDTARSLVLLRRMGKPVDLQPLIQTFSHGTHFKTYEMERNPSFSANCNVLLALLEGDSASDNQYRTQIESILHFLVELWNSGTVNDKWNLSSAYSEMLLSEALVCFMERLNAGSLQLSEESTTLCQAVTRVLHEIVAKSVREQTQGGSWDECAETTAYRIMTIAQCYRLPWTQISLDYLAKCVRRGQTYLSTGVANSYDQAHTYHWIEKTSYVPQLVRTAYCVAAAHVTLDQPKWENELQVQFQTPESSYRKLYSMMEYLPLFRKNSLPPMELVCAQTKYFSERLQEKRCSVFPRDDIPMTKDKYLTFLPMIWLSCNSISEQPLPSKVIWEMLLLSMFNYQIDEYMESVVDNLEDPALDALVTVIKSTCQKNGMEQVFSGDKSHAAIYDTKQTLQGPAASVVVKYIHHILQHPSVVASPLFQQRQLATQVQNFLLAHIDHNRDGPHRPRSGHWRHGPSATNSGGSCGQDYFEWVRTIASDDTSCPFSFQFFLCLISKPGEMCLTNTRDNYIAKSLAKSLATMCRQYNDYGSCNRDMEEGTLNSLNFPEFDVTSSRAQLQKASGPTNGTNGVNGDFHDSPPSSSSSSSDFVHDLQSKKESLMEIAEFERECMQLALRKLEQSSASVSTINALEVFIDVTDVFGQVYVQKDIASRRSSVEARA